MTVKMKVKMKMKMKVKNENEGESKNGNEGEFKDVFLEREYVNDNEANQSVSDEDSIV